MIEDLTRQDLEKFLEKITGTRDVFALFEQVGIYGSQDYLFNQLKSKLLLCMDYLKVDFSTLFKKVLDYQKKNPPKEFEAVNLELYQDEMYPIMMTIYYAISEPFMLRKIVKQELFRLIFKLWDIRKVFIAGVGCGEIFENIARVPTIQDFSQILVRGVDISAPAIKFCNWRSELYKFKIVSEVADLDFYEFDRKYDLVELSEVVEHVREPQKLLNIIASASKLIFVTIPLMLEAPGHLHLFSLSQVKELIENAGLDVIYESIRNSFYVRQFFYFAVLKGKI